MGKLFEHDCTQEDPLNGLTDTQRAVFHHEALFYADEGEFLEGAVPFLREGVDAGEPALVAVDKRKIRLLEDALDGDAEGVSFTDMAELGRNPARIIPAWRDFLGEHTLRGQRVRGIAEPIWPGRSQDELAECQHHESLLNLAFAGAPGWCLMCPYDVAGLDDAVLEGAHHTHPHLVEDGAGRPSESYTHPPDRPLGDRLLDPPAPPDELVLGFDGLHEAREFVAERSGRAGLSESRTGDLALAVTELATNSIRHGGGTGWLRMWREPDAVVCEMLDSGCIFDPLVGRQRPSPTQARGRGLWIVNQLCDLVQIRSLPEGSAVRIRMALDAA